MRMPRRRGTAVSDERVDKWLERFSAFRDSPTRGDLERWLDRFQADHKDIAARVLDCVEVISSQNIRASMRRALGELPGWSKDDSLRVGQWAFIASEASPGESGGSMLHLFRQAVGMSSSTYNHFFKYNRDIPELEYGPQDSLVFIDDFAGSGEQICTNWKIINELETGGANKYLILIAAPSSAVQKIGSETEYNILVDITLNNYDNFFSKECRYFKEDEKNTIENYCKKASRKLPKGYGECGLLIVFQHGCPNNSIPVLHSSNPRWRGLFPRYDFATRDDT